MMREFDRGIDESLIIGQDVVVTVLEIQDNYVRLGILNPNSLPSYREEIVSLDDEEQAVSVAGLELLLR